MFNLIWSSAQIRIGKEVIKICKLSGLELNNSFLIDNRVILILLRYKKSFQNLLNKIIKNGKMKVSVPILGLVAATIFIARF
jgi:hypothetical protein